MEANKRTQSFKEAADDGITGLERDTGHTKTDQSMRNMSHPNYLKQVIFYQVGFSIGLPLMIIFIIYFMNLHIIFAIKHKKVGKKVKRVIYQSPR